MDNAPDTSTEKAVILFRILLINRNSTESEIGKPCFIVIISQVQFNCHLIYDGHCATLTQFGQNFFCFIRADIVIRKNALHILYALLNNFVIIRTAILPKEELKDIGRHIRTLLDFLRQVFSDNFPIKVLAQLVLDYFTSTGARFKIVHLVVLLGSIF